MQADSCVALVNDAQAAADKLGWTITLLDANGDPATQADQMNTLIAKKVDAIILNPTDVASLKPSIEAAKEAGIPVFGVGMEMNDECMSMLLSFAGLDDYNLALAGGKWIAEKYNGKGAEVALITGVAATDPTTKTINALQAAIKDTDIKFDGSYEGKFDAATAMSITEDLLVSNPGLDVIFCQDHVMAGGAASAIADAGKTGKIAVVCVMGMKDYLSYIKDGAIDCAAFVLIEKCGGFAINSLNDYWNGTTLATKYYLDPLMVTADNVDGASDQEFNFSPAT
jgi:ABC-type sugar transport system substrate-binding protein